jgi:hypothetical protein
MRACYWASVAELVDALDSKSSAERRAGSIPAGGTTHQHGSDIDLPLDLSDISVGIIYTSKNSATGQAMRASITAA